MKKHYRPVANLPITFFLKSCAEVVHTVNGFKIIRVTGPTYYHYYYQCGKHIWQEVQ